MQCSIVSDFYFELCVLFYFSQFSFALQLEPDQLYMISIISMIYWYEPFSDISVSAFTFANAKSLTLQNRQCGKYVNLNFAFYVQIIIFSIQLYIWFYYTSDS